jgi:hypothetical protein
MNEYPQQRLAGKSDVIAMADGKLKQTVKYNPFYPLSDPEWENVLPISATCPK